MKDSEGGSIEYKRLYRKYQRLERDLKACRSKNQRLLKKITKLKKHNDFLRSPPRLKSSKRPSFFQVVAATETEER